MITPFLAKTNFTLLILSRLVAGISQAGIFPATYALVASWNTMTEANVMSSLIKTALRIGVLLGSLIPGLVDDWETVYYITGGLCMVWSVLWVLIATSIPEKNICVSRSELYRIVRKKPIRLRELTTVKLDDGKVGSKADNKRSKSALTTWWRILSHPAVIGLFLTKLCTNFGTDFLTMLLPTYIKDVFHGTKQDVS